LYSAGLVDGGGGVSITISDIPYTQYDVYVYASQDTYLTNTLSITDGTTTFYYASNGFENFYATSLLLTTSTNSASPTTGPGQYQLFANEPASSLTLTTGGAIGNVISNQVFGVQIVDEASSTPEPASLLMFSGGLGLLGLLARRTASFRSVR
jgi:hypothetical protein